VFEADAQPRGAPTGSPGRLAARARAAGALITGAPHRVPRSPYWPLRAA